MLSKEVVFRFLIPLVCPRVLASSLFRLFLARKSGTALGASSSSIAHLQCVGTDQRFNPFFDPSSHLFHAAALHSCQKMKGTAAGVEVVRTVDYNRINRGRRPVLRRG